MSINDNLFLCYLCNSAVDRNKHTGKKIDRKVFYLSWHNFERTFFVAYSRFYGLQNYLICGSCRHKFNLRVNEIKKIVLPEYIELVQKETYLKAVLMKEKM